MYATGAELDPQEVLGVMGQGMPLSVAVPTLERMLRERTHRTRQMSVLKNLHRACHLRAAAERAEVSRDLIVAPGLWQLQASAEGLALAHECLKERKHSPISVSRVCMASTALRLSISARLLL